MSAKLINWILAAGTAAAAAAAYREMNTIGVAEFAVSHKKLPRGFDGCRIAHIADLHGKRFDEKNRKLAAVLHELAPDFVIASGDMENFLDLGDSAFLDAVAEMRLSIPVYYAFGNHEQSWLRRARAGGAKVLPGEKEFAARGVTLIRKGCVTLTRGGDTARLWGLEVPESFFTARDRVGMMPDAAFFEKLTGKPNPADFNMLIAHSPNYFEEYAAWGADLTFSGHIHGGMVRLGPLGGVFSPNRRFFPRYCEGVYPCGEARMSVSRGLGNSAAMFRLWNNPEVVLLTLKRKTQE